MTTSRKTSFNQQGKGVTMRVTLPPDLDEFVQDLQKIYREATGKMLSKPDAICLMLRACQKGQISEYNSMIQFFNLLKTI